MIKSILTEYGLPWAINRTLYSVKLKMMTAMPVTENLFERRVDVKKINIFNLNVTGIKRFLVGLSMDKQNEIVLRADRATEGVITGFSSIELDYGNPIKWHYSPLTNVESNRKLKWYRIPDFDAELGDIKVVWEASRFTHFHYLTRAYLITGDKKYYDAYSEQLQQWLEDNPYPYGANYKCGQECTLRMMNTLMAYAIFQNNGLTTSKDEGNVSKLVEVCYKKVLANFFYAYKCIKNNHTLSEICGLIIGAWCCEDEGRLRKAYGLLDEVVQKQFLSDGGYIQYSFNYQRFALQIMECVYKISEKTGYSMSETSKGLIKKSALLMYQMQDITGAMPNYGSNDGALIFPVTVCGYRDFTPVINTVYALVTDQVLFDKGDHDEELLWFGSGDKFLVNRVNKRSAAFKESGFYTLQHDGGFLMTILQDYSTRPAQMDELHVDLWHNGKNIFCDSGTYSYATNIGKGLASTEAHNTVKVAKVGQMNKKGAFLIYDWTNCKDVKHDEDSFSGVMVSKNGYEHRRQIVRTEHGYEIADEVRGDAEYCEFKFHTPFEVRLIPDGFEVWNSDMICSVRTTIGAITASKSYMSLYYLQKEEINCVSIRENLDGGKCNVIFDIKLY